VLPGIAPLSDAVPQEMGGFRPGAGQPAARQIGLVKRNEDGIRLPARRAPLQLIVRELGRVDRGGGRSRAGRDTWREIGVKPFSKPSQLTVFRNRIFSGETMVAIAKGLDDGLVTADRPPLSSPRPASSNTSGRNGDSTPRPRQGRRGAGHAAGRELLRLNNAWLAAGSRDERRKIWEDILATQTAMKVLSIGLVAGVPQPVVIGKHLRNIPADRGLQLGSRSAFRDLSPDTFWFSNDAQAALPPAGRSAELTRTNRCSATSSGAS